MLLMNGHVTVGAATWWTAWEQEVPQTEPQKESVAWDLPDTFAFYKGDLKHIFDLCSFVSEINIVIVLI